MQQHPKIIKNTPGYLRLIDAIEKSEINIGREEEEDIGNLLQLSNKIGNNSEYIQASGGNTSLKIKNYLLVKASGKKLGDCLKENIFTMLDLKNFDREKCSFKSSKDILSSNLRPSIETSLHAILKSKFVVHSHPESVISTSIDANNKDRDKYNTRERREVLIKYVKPGQQLAEEVKKNIEDEAYEYYSLQNHGLLFSSDEGKELLNIHNTITNKHKIRKQDVNHSTDNIEMTKLKNKLARQGMKTRKPNNSKVNGLAFNHLVFQRMRESIIFPDAAVFLGNKNIFLDKYEEENIITKESLEGAKFIVLKDAGVLIVDSDDMSGGQYVEELLEMHFNIFSSIPVESNIYGLRELEVADLINWDAEKYRSSMLRSEKI